MPKTTRVRAPAAIFFLLAAGLTACAPDARSRNVRAAESVIERSAVAGAFIDVSTATAAALRHAQSGMLCALPANGTFQVETFPASAANQGAACTYAIGGVATTLIAMRFREPVGLDRAFADATAMSARLEGAERWEGAPSAADMAAPDGLPHFRIARISGRADGAPVYLRVALSEARGWFVQQIVFAPLDQADAVEAEAGRDWRAMLSGLASGESPAAAE